MESHLNPESNPRFQKIDKAALLSQCSLFSGLSQWELKSIANLMRLVEYKKNEFIYKQGEAAGNFHVVVSGRFEAYIHAFDKKKVLAYLHRGDFFGEMSLLTNQPHSATLRALSDSLVLELDQEDFRKTVENSAKISLELSRRLSSRLKGNDPGNRILFKSDVVSIFGNHHRIGRTSFSINLAASLYHETRQRTILLDMSPSGTEISAKLHIARKVPISHFRGIEGATSNVLQEFIVSHHAGFDVLSVAHDETSSAGADLIVSVLNHLAIDYRFIVIDLPAGIDETVFRALTHSDFIFFMTDSNINTVNETRSMIADLEKTLAVPEEKIGVVINEVLLGIRTTGALRKELFGNKKCYSLQPSQQFREHDDSRVPFVVAEPDVEYSRTVRHIARYISNNLVGLVLGSGAALGLCHIGVLKVLEREKIPIDIIAGSSIGALLGALYASGMRSAEMEQAALAINIRLLFTRLLDFNLFPFRGILHGDQIIRHFSKYLKGRSFDECRIPLRIVATNLTTRQIMVLDSGSVTQAVRMSIAIPAIVTPIIARGETIVDGGILSPLPIQALHEAGANKIIAVNVFPTSTDIQERLIHTEEAKRKEEELVRKKNIFKRAQYAAGRRFVRFITPNYFDIIMEMMQVMEAQIAEIEAGAADLVLHPVVPNASWIHFYKPKPFIQQGEEEAMRLLPKIKSLVAQQNA